MKNLSDFFLLFSQNQKGFSQLIFLASFYVSHFVHGLFLNKVSTNNLSVLKIKINPYYFLVRVY